MSTIKVKTDLLNSYKTTFDNEKNRFIYTACNTLKNSYLATCSDSTVQAMYSKLISLYSVVDKSYSSISSYWANFLSDFNNLENSMVNDNSLFSSHDISTLSIDKGNSSYSSGSDSDYSADWRPSYQQGTSGTYEDSNNPWSDKVKENLENGGHSSGGSHGFGSLKSSSGEKIDETKNELKNKSKSEYKENKVKESYSSKEIEYMYNNNPSELEYILKAGNVSEEDIEKILNTYDEETISIALSSNDSETRNRNISVLNSCKNNKNMNKNTLNKALEGSNDFDYNTALVTEGSYGYITQDSTMYMDDESYRRNHGACNLACHDINYGTNYSVNDSNDSRFFTNANKNDVKIQYGGSVPTIIWLPENLNDYQMNQLRELNEEVKKIYNSNPSYYDENPITFQIAYNNNYDVVIETTNGLDELIEAYDK